MEVEVGWATTEHRFNAMGTNCHVLVVGPAGDGHISRAVESVDRLERLWSRFDPDSEVSRLRLADGATVTVTPETFALIEHAVLAWQMTRGRFDPTMADRMVELGYDRSFEMLTDLSQAGSVGPGSSPASVPDVPSPAAGCSGIFLSRTDSSVRLPAGIGIDPGGIGKGLAADLVSRELMDRGAWGVMVNLGGDLRVRGTPPSGDEWVIDVVEPTVMDGSLATVRLVDCALATSTTGRRRWTGGDDQLHHLIDPDTGLPFDTDIDLVSSIAGEGWWAEATATALSGHRRSSGDSNEAGAVDDDGLVDPRLPPSCAALLVRSDRTIERLGDFERYEA